ncbi:PREDICTED: techylectin-5A-like [Branchiostoma belcheri]|uniref:Techylectin-5A-like n=1 Tax=Branchiostoma belcheri TaxID=7741 RepID=A0A6P4ZWP3_BRABE|nr:PREDICTED: techylectin-5A-like [Branchiostoma belcheri]
MSSKKLFPNSEAAPEGSVGRHGNQRTLGISITLSGLAAMVSFVALLFMVRELASIREQQTAFMREIRDQQTAFMGEIRDQQTAFMREIRDQQTAFMREIRDQQTAFMGEIRDQQTAFMGEIRDQQTAFMREIRDQQTAFMREIRDQQTAFMREIRDQQMTIQTDLQGLKDQVLQMQLRQENKAKDKVTTQATTTPAPIDTDCAAYKAAGHSSSGVYTLGSPLSGVTVYCDMDTAGGGWTVIQRRLDGSVPFNKNWEEYKHGFGNKNGEYWLGNENIHRLTAQKDYSLRIDMMDWSFLTRYAECDTFRVSGELDQYRLTVSGYSGTAGDSMAGAHSLSGLRFSTVDRDNDAHPSLHCCETYGLGGWWYRACSDFALNGRYLGNCGNSCGVGQGVMWNTWTGQKYSLKSVSMKIRPG